MPQEHHNGNISHVAEFRKGNTTAFSHYYHLFYTPLRYFAEQMTGDQAAAADIVADIFVKLWQKHAHFNTEANIKSFLYISTKNACLDLLKHLRLAKRSHQAIADNSLLEEDITFNQVIRTELYWSIYNAIEQLPAGCRNIFKMSYLDDMKNQEIADKLHLSVKTVKNQKARAIQLLRQRLSEEHMAAWLLLCTCLASQLD
jgi:RNA polymerase sigma-70 factor (ECF subfamily)